MTITVLYCIGILVCMAGAVLDVTEN